ncbi:MAG: glycosyltransferase [Acidobacteriota bacterium]
MDRMKVIFFASLLLIIYLHGGYALILFVMEKLRGRDAASPDEDAEGSIAVVVGAYNEEAVIGKKIESLLAQTWKRPIRIIVVSDCSTDATDRIVESYSGRGVELRRPAKRQGKAANFSEIVPTLKEEIVILTDASGVFARDTVERLMGPLRDPSVGCVGGRIVYGNVDATGISRSEGLYWRYEVLLRTLESRPGGTVIISGGCYAIRRSLFRPVPGELPDDSLSPLNVWDQGFRVAYAPDALVHETMAETVEGEYRTKVRIISRNFVALMRMRHLLNPIRRPVLAWKLYSHRLLRWLVIPLLAVFLGANLALLDGPLYQAVLVAQCTFYAAAVIGSLPAARRWKIFQIPFYFCLVNLAALAGVCRGLSGSVSGTWEPVERNPGR